MIVKNIILNPQITTGRVGQVLFFGYTIEPSNASDKRIEITSSDPEIIDVQGNSFRFIREGFSTITIRSLDNGFRRDFVVSSVSSEDGSFNGLVREAEYDIKNYKEEMKRELQKDKEIIKSELSVFEENTKKLIESEREKIINDFKNVNDSNLDEINKHVNSKINEIISISKDVIIELNSATNLSKKDLDAKIKELNDIISSMYYDINEYILTKQEEINEYSDTLIETTKTEINNHSLYALSEIQNKYRDIISNIESSENFALSNIEVKFTDAVAYIESVEATSVNNIEYEKDRLISEIRKEVSEISNIIQSETENAVQIILNKEAEAMSEITKLEFTIKSTINVELERATSVIASELTSVIDTMNEHCRALINQLTEHKSNLMNEIAVDKDNMLLELEREKNRLIQLIRSEEANLFKNLHETQQEIINNIQTTVQGYDVELEAIKNEKIQSIQIAVNGYDEMITDAKIAAQESVTNLGNAFLSQLTSEKDSHVSEMQVEKNALSGELASEKGIHSTNLTGEYNDHKNALNNQVNNSSTGLKKQLSDDYSTHSSNLSKEKTSHSGEMTTLKNNSVTEITNLKNSSLDEIGRNINQGQWKIVRDSIIATGVDEKGKVTTEGVRIQELLLGIENNIVQQGNSALAAIGTSDSTGKRGEAVSSIETHKTNAVNMIGTSNNSMNGSSPSVRKDAYDAIISAKNSSIAEINTTKVNKVNEADVEITAIKNTANAEMESNKNKHIATMQTKADELQGSLNANGSVTNVGDTMVKRDTNGDIFVRYVNGVLKGNADTASKLSAAKIFTFSGDVSGSVSFDGSTNVTASLQVADDSHNHVIANVDNLQSELNTLKSNADGRVSKLGDTMTGTLTIGTIRNSAGGDLIRSGGTSGDAVVVGDASKKLVSYSNANPQLNINSSTHTFYHTGFKPNKTDVGLNLVDNTADSSKNVLSATKLTTARTIGGVSFDGTANINLPGVNTSGNQNTTGSSASCTGNSATATKLETARTINGTNFDGTKAITTENWGTGRTITIGNTGKTVNGSGNVAWSIAELGAAPTTHTHPVSQLTGGATISPLSIWSSNTSGSYDSRAIELREVNTVGAAQSGDEYAPAIGFHWGNRFGKKLFMNSSGRLVYDGEFSATKVYNAIWNDYAEYFPKKENYITEAGDIIALCEDSDEEIYVLATENHTMIVGAHSDQYGHLIGGEEAPNGVDFVEHNDKKFIPVGLVGRLPVKFIGEAKKGIKVVPSHIPGVGRKFNPETDSYDNVIGYIVENNNEEGIRRVKIKIGK